MMYATRLPLMLIAATTVVTIASGASQAQFRDFRVEEKELMDVRPPVSPLKVELFTPTDEARIGDEYKVFVKTNRDAYIWVIDIGSSNKVHIVFPNQYQKDNRVLAHQMVQVPASDANWRLRVAGPSGQNGIKVIATTQSDAVINPDKLAQLGPIYEYKDTTRSLTRNLEVVFNNGATHASAEKIIRILDQKSAITPNAPPAKRAEAVAVPTAQPPQTRISEAPGAPKKMLKPDELYRLGSLAYNGDGGAPDYRRALELFTEAADGGHVGAMFLAGRIHEQGLDVDQNAPRAKDLYRRAADLGSTQAMVHLAILHVKSGSVDRQPAEAVRLLRKAASQGDGMAMIHLAKMHDEGHGVEKDPREGARYLLSALKTGAWTVLDQAPKMSEEARRELQAQLRDAGHYKGVIDGLVGAETRAALADWAKAG